MKPSSIQTESQVRFSPQPLLQRASRFTASVFSTTAFLFMLWTARAWADTAPAISSISTNQAFGATQTATITVAATGTPLNYQWKRNGVNVTDNGRISGSLAATLTIGTVAVSDAGTYTVSVTNTAGAVTGGPTTLTVVMPPIVSAITNVISGGTNVIFTANVTPPEALYNATYFWNKEGVDLSDNTHIQGANRTNLTILNANSSDTGSYQIAVFNLAGVATNNPDLGAGAVFAAPVIGSATGDQVAALGDPVNFNVTTSAGTGPLTYQWRANFGNLSDGSGVSGATTPSLTITAVGTANYDVVVKNIGGQAVSTPAHLTISGTGTAASILTQPTNTTAECGGAATFRVGGAGTAPLSYQWYLGSTPVATGTSSSLTLSGVNASASGSYSVVVSNSFGSITSQAAVLAVVDTTAPVININGSAVTNIAVHSPYTDLGATASDSCEGALTVNTFGTVNTNVAGTYTITYIATDSSGNSATNTRLVSLLNAPVIVTSPVSQHVNLHGTASFTVVATGAPTLKYQWYELRGATPVALAGKTSSTLTFSVTSAAQELDYFAVVANTFGKATSAVAHLTLDLPPVITVQPVVVLRPIAGNDVSFSVTATGSATLDYQWNFNGTPIGGATTATLSLSNVQTNNSGTYTVTVSNYTGIAVTSLTTHGILQVQRDTVKPVVTLTAPAINATFTNGQIVAGTTIPQINVSGTATDNGLITSVSIQRITPVVESPVSVGLVGALPGHKTFTNQFTLLDGTNTFQVTATDSAGNVSLPVKRSVVFAVKSTLTLLTNGIGHITSTTGATNQAHLVIGRNYTVSAVEVAKSNWLFASWSSGPDLGSLTELSTNPVLVFNMSSNLFLRANFVTNPFTAIVGNFNGLFYPSNGVTEASSGLFTVTFTAGTKGAYTGKISLDGGTYPLNGGFNVDGDSTVNVTRAGKTPVTVRLHLNLNPSDNVITGSVSNTAFVSSLYGEISQFNGTTLVNTNYSGRYTLKLSANGGVPAGDGAVTITNNHAGNTLFAGNLSDGSVVSESVQISKLGNVPFYVSLYAGKGSIIGWLAFSTNSPRTISGTLIWTKPAVIKTVYPLGFTNSVTAVGNEYDIPAKGIRLLGLTAGTLTLTGADLGADLVFNVALSTNNLLTVTGGATNSLAVVFTPATGAVKVTFKPTGSTKLTIGQGVVLQGETNATGWFLGTNTSGSFILQ